MLRVRERLHNLARPALVAALDLWGERLPCRLLLASIPKSGSHLCQALLNHLPQVRIRPVTLLPYRDVRDYRDALAANTRVSYAWGHLGYNAAVQQLLEEFPDYKVLVFLRDPRDVVCSFVDHVARKPHVLKASLATLAPSERVDTVIAGVPAERYARNPAAAEQGVYDMYPGFAPIDVVCRSYLAWKDHPRAAFFHYEDLLDIADRGTRKAGRRQGIDALIDFLGIALPASQQRELVRAAYDRNSPTFNVGRINRFREIFTPAQQAAFARAHGELLDDMGYAP